MGRTKKLAKLWKGPFVVVRVINDLNYEVKPVGKKKGHIIIHFNRMMRWPDQQVLSDNNVGDNSISESFNPVRRSGRTRKMPKRYDQFVFE